MVDVEELDVSFGIPQTEAYATFNFNEEDVPAGAEARVEEVVASAGGVPCQPAALALEDGLQGVGGCELSVFRGGFFRDGGGGCGAEGLVDDGGGIEVGDYDVGVVGVDGLDLVYWGEFCGESHGEDGLLDGGVWIPAGEDQLVVGFGVGMLGMRAEGVEIVGAVGAKDEVLWNFVGCNVCHVPRAFLVDVEDEDAGVLVVACPLCHFPQRAQQVGR